jgi:hypothetical protein
VHFAQEEFVEDLKNRIVQLNGLIDIQDELISKQNQLVIIDDEQTSFNQAKSNFLKSEVSKLKGFFTLFLKKNLGFRLAFIFRDIDKNADRS